MDLSNWEAQAIFPKFAPEHAKKQTTVWSLDKIEHP